MKTEQEICAEIEKLLKDNNMVLKSRTCHQIYDDGETALHVCNENERYKYLSYKDKPQIHRLLVD